MHGGRARRRRVSDAWCGLHGNRRAVRSPLINNSRKNEARVTSKTITALAYGGEARKDAWRWNKAVLPWEKQKNDHFKPQKWQEISSAGISTGGKKLVLSRKKIKGTLGVSLHLSQGAAWAGAYLPKKFARLFVTLIKRPQKKIDWGELQKSGARHPKEGSDKTAALRVQGGACG